MSSDNIPVIFRFGDFLLDTQNRRLWRGREAVDLSGRYFDALVLLVKEHGRLVGKDRLFDEVWDGVVVSDSALTQCIKDVRKQLGDDATHPRFIQTVPRYGYRFIWTVVVGSPEVAPLPRAESGGANLAPGAEQAWSWAGEGGVQRALVQGGAGTVGGAAAGMLGGLLYGFGLAHTADAQMGTASIVIVLVALNVGVGAIGGFGVSFGMAARHLGRRLHPGWSIAGGALGGMLVGAIAKLLGVDAFTLLFGRAPAGITGGMEGAVLGAALAVGALAGGGLDAVRWWRPVVGAGVAGSAAGLVIPLAGGHLMGGSLELLARSFTSSRLQLDTLGRFFGEVHFGGTAQVVLGGIEGFLFGSCVVGAMVLAQRVWRRPGAGVT
ncbi:hypothetical protein BH23BAC4_BH23BAC4_08600 [soil metagenome]